jgi:hypothetical protein
MSILTYLKPQSLDADLSHTLDAFLNAVQLAQVVLCVHNINISQNVHLLKGQKNMPTVIPSACHCACMRVKHGTLSPLSRQR